MKTKMKLSGEDGLRELARLIVRDGVTCSGLADYLKPFLDRGLLKLDAASRRWANELWERIGERQPAALAVVLCDKADELAATSGSACLPIIRGGSLRAVARSPRRNGRVVLLPAWQRVKGLVRSLSDRTPPALPTRR